MRSIRLLMQDANLPTSLLALTRDFALANIMSWLILGFMAGFIAHIIDNRVVRGGFLGTLMMGVLGALAGGYLTNLFLGIGITGLNLTSLLSATGGALLLSFIWRGLMAENEENDDYAMYQADEDDRSYVPGRVTALNPVYYSQVTPLSDREEREIFNRRGKVTSRRNRSIQRFLDEVNYPISKPDLIRYVEQHDGDEEILSTLEAIPNHIYDTPTEIKTQIKRLHRS